MSEKKIIDSAESVENNDTPDMQELFRVMLAGKWVILLTTLIFSLSAIALALYLPNQYRSDALLSPVSENANLQIPGQLGGLAALAGVNLAGLGGGDNTGLAIEVMKSREFISRFIDKYDLILPIMGAKGWDRSSDSLIYDVKKYNPDNQQWVRKVKTPFQPKPSLLETYEEFMKLFNVSQDKLSGMVKVSVEHYSPYLAQSWTSLLVKEINDVMRARELEEAQRSINYLNEQLQQTNIADVKTMLFSLIEEQTKTVMLANVRNEYVFKTIDSAVVAEKKSKPQRPLIVILGFLLGSMLSMLFVLIRHFSKKRTKN